MAQINMPTRPAQEQRDPRKESDLDKILRGVQVAAGLTGIASNIQSARVSGRKLDADTRAQEGIITPAEEQKANLLRVPEGTPGARKFTSSVGDEPINLIAAAEPRKIAKVIVRHGDNIGIDAQGNDVKNLGPVEPKDAQKKNAGFAVRMAKADEALSDLMASGFDPTAESLAVTNHPWVPEVLRGDDAKRFNQAAYNFIAAYIRPESGAAVPESEVERGTKIYMPQPGDPDDLVEVKRQNRIFVRMAVEAGAGPEAMSAVGKRIEADMDAGRIPRRELAGVKLSKKAAPKLGVGQALAKPKRTKATGKDKAALDELAKNPGGPQAKTLRKILEAKGIDTSHIPPVKGQ